MASSAAATAAEAETHLTTIRAERDHLAGQLDEVQGQVLSLVDLEGQNAELAGTRSV